MTVYHGNTDLCKALWCMCAEYQLGMIRDEGNDPGQRESGRAVGDATQEVGSTVSKIQPHRLTSVQLTGRFPPECHGVGQTPDLPYSLVHN